MLEPVETQPASTIDDSKVNFGQFRETNKPKELSKLKGKKTSGSPKSRAVGTGSTTSSAVERNGIAATAKSMDSGSKSQKNTTNRNEEAGEIMDQAGDGSSGDLQVSRPNKGEDGTNKRQRQGNNMSGSGNSSDKTESKSSNKMNGDGEKKADTPGGSSSKEKKAEKNGGSGGGQQAPASATPSPPPPVLRGTLSYNQELRRHLIRGMWNYENSNAFPAQRFELIRTLGPSEDVTVLPKDGEFHGSFSLAYFHTTSKGKQKERSKVIKESGVKITFTKIEGEEREYKVDGRGTNQFGIFHINGTAVPSTHEGDPSFNISLRKRYEQSAPKPSGEAVNESKKEKKLKKRKHGSITGGARTPDDELLANAEQDAGPLPEPSPSFPANVVCLRGKLVKEESDDLGVTQVVHRINGMWASGLDTIVSDPKNVRGQCNRFEYEHKCTVASNTFPITGRYSGWFELSNEDGTRSKLNERDVFLRFRKNNAGFHNVEGRGSNAFGKYNITGTLTQENVITIFRHFLPRKPKTKPVTSAPPPINTPGQPSKPLAPPAPEPQIKLDEVKVPGENNSGVPIEPITAPVHPTYSAVSRGVLRVNDDGSHSCQGKWAVTREHFAGGQTSNFNFRLEAHFVTKAMEELKNGDDGLSKPRAFPLDSELYKGSFQLKKQGARPQTVIDQQIVMKFRLNKSGSYNVYGKGVNGIGIFDLIGTLILSGKAGTGGQVELYRMYPPELLGSNSIEPPTSAPKPNSVPEVAPKSGDVVAPIDSSITPGSSVLSAPALNRRESTRLVKPPSRLEEDDPKAQLSRLMEKCASVLRVIRDEDMKHRAFFSEPVDPVALGIPTYHQIISEPMDLGTIHRKMEAKEIDAPEEFSRLVRLVFENAIKFNVEPTHSVHQAARYLLGLFNQKFRDTERQIQSFRRANKGTEFDKESKAGKDDKKRKRPHEEAKSLKRRRLEEAQAMANANAEAINAIVEAAPAEPGANVTRTEFSMMLNMLKLLQQQVVQTHTALADISPTEEPGDADATTGSQVPPSSAAPPSREAAAPPKQPERRKSAKKKAEAPKSREEPQGKAREKPVEKPREVPQTIPDDSKPLTLAEQELLTDTINALPAEQLPAVIQIIRESAGLSGDEDEIDLEIDQLDTATQRKLLRHVSKFIKQPKRQKPKAPKKTKTLASEAPPRKTDKGERTDKNEKAEKKPTPKRPKPPPKPKQEQMFAFESKEDSDTESEDEAKPSNDAAKRRDQSSDHFNLGDDFAEHDDDHDDDHDDLGTGGFAAKWDVSKPSTDSSAQGGGGGGDAEWDALREAAAANAAREADRKAREEKMLEEAEREKQQRLADAAAKGHEILARRQEEEANEAKLREKKEKEAVEEAKRKVRDMVGGVEKTVDIGDAQRKIMQEYEQSFADKELGSGSPSSDFGF